MQRTTKAIFVRGAESVFVCVFFFLVSRLTVYAAEFPFHSVSQRATGETALR